MKLKKSPLLESERVININYDDLIPKQFTSWDKIRFNEVNKYAEWYCKSLLLIYLN